MALNANGNPGKKAVAFPSMTDPNHQIKYLVVTGGTLSGLGKGTTISSIGVVLKSCGLRVTSIKIDPYLNIDAGTMSPYEHGEVFVLEDGGEVDLDLGNYERFLEIGLTRDHNITTGKIYEQVLARERKGDYLGKSVQVVPHVTDAIQSWIQAVASRPVDGQAGPPDVCLVEVGGTVGDIESSVYLEALQQFSYKVGLDNFCLCQVGFVPVMGVVGEQKTKPTQHSVRELRMAGLKPDFVFCRSEDPLEESTKRKIAMFGQVPVDHVISVHDVPNIYHVPLNLMQQNAGKLLCERLKLQPRPSAPLLKAPPCPSLAATASAATGSSTAPLTPMGGGPNDGEVFDLRKWTSMANRADQVTTPVRIGVVGKYTGLADSYLSVIKALKHAGIEGGLDVIIEWIESTDLEPTMKMNNPSVYEAAWKKLHAVDGVLCPGGFGDRGVEGKIEAAKYCRTSNTPYFGICLGLQIAVIEYARNELGWTSANSEEFDKETTHPVVVFMPEVSTSHMGGTMRLGSRCTIIRDQSSKAYQLYDKEPVVYERHRHRYEVNPAVVTSLENGGKPGSLKFVGTDERAQRMEIVEIPDHRFFLAVQYHPEFKSRPMHPSPPFLGFVLAAAGVLEERLARNNGRLLAGSGLDEPLTSPLLASPQMKPAASLGAVKASNNKAGGALPQMLSPKPIQS